MRREIVLTKEGNAFIFVGASPLHAFNCIPDDDDDDDDDDNDDPSIHDSIDLIKVKQKHSKFNKLPFE